MGRPNWTRTLAYSTAMSKHIWAPPTCSAASATAARSSTCSSTGQPPPSAPSRAASTPSKVSLACLRVWSMVDSGVRVSPAASASTKNSDTPEPVRAATTSRSAVWPSSTYVLIPSSLHEPAPFEPKPDPEPEPEPEPDAAMVMPVSSQRPLSSVKASAPRRRPEARSGR